MSGHFEMCRELYSMFWLDLSIFFESERHTVFGFGTMCYFWDFFVVDNGVHGVYFFYCDDTVYGVNSGEVEGDQS